MLSGVFVAVDRLPGFLGSFSGVLPLRWGMDAAMAVLDGSPMPVSLLLAELAVGAAWGAVGYLFFRVMLVSARREGTLRLV